MGLGLSEIGATRGTNAAYYSWLGIGIALFIVIAVVLQRDKRNHTMRSPSPLSKVWYAWTTRVFALAIL